MRRTELSKRTRWVSLGAACAMALGASGLLTASASVGSGERAVFVPITPCRTMDTRSGSDNVGPRSTPIGEGETHTIAARGTNGNCTIPADALGLVLNVTAVNGTAKSFLTVFPSDAAKPLAANLNWVAGQPPSPNAVTVRLSADGKVSFFNFAGTVDVIADVAGYYADHIFDDRYYTKPEVDALLAAAATQSASQTAVVDAKVAGKEDKTAGPLILASSSFVSDGYATGTHQFLTDRIRATGVTCLAAAVDLPDGSTMTGAVLHAADTNASVGLSASVYANPVGPVSPSLIANGATTGSSGEQAVAMSMAPLTIDTQTTSYFATVCLSGAQMEFIDIAISYTNP